ncbi:MAG: phosphoadenylyl-sulfate reductase [Chlorobiales bacterium]|nr:phosphoadenylyl-sulfate reductase [Chlorobiales bacterium]
MSQDIVEKLRNELQGKSPEEIIRHTLNYFGTESTAFASSFGAEDQVITDMLVRENKEAQIFTLDTGRLPQETYDVLDATRKWYQIKIDVLFPETAAVEAMLREYGPNLFYESVENRKKCCQVRKVVPLRKKLSTLKAWICGLRREQSVTRTGVEVIEWDDAFQLYKINPLADYTENEVWDYIRKHDVPYNKLHDQGYPSIGCAPCTRPITPGEDVRAGRWWWETPEHKECGLHIKASK